MTHPHPSYDDDDNDDNGAVHNDGDDNDDDDDDTKVYNKPSCNMSMKGQYTHSWVRCDVLLNR